MAAAKDKPATVKVRATQNVIGEHQMAVGDEAELEHTEAVRTAIAQGVFEVIDDDDEPKAKK